MARLRSMWAWGAVGVLCAGCVSQVQYDAIAKSNLQLQDKLAASQAERVKTRTQIALLRQELVQAKQAEQDVHDQMQSVIAEADTLRARLDIQAKRLSGMAAQTQPAATRPGQ